jgi:hypothetical protein
MQRRSRKKKKAGRDGGRMWEDVRWILRARGGAARI